MALRRFLVVVSGAKICLAANPLRSDRRKRTKDSIAAVQHLYLDSDIDGEPALLRSGPPIQFPRRPQSSRHRLAYIRSSGALIVSISSGREAPSTCSRFPLAEIRPARTATGLSACRDSGIARTIRRIPSPSNTLAIRLRIQVTFGWIFRRQMTCLCPCNPIAKGPRQPHQFRTRVGVDPVRTCLRKRRREAHANYCFPPLG